MAKYLFDGALTREQKAALLLDRKDGVEAALDALRPIIERELAAEAKQALADLNMGFRAVGDWERARMTAAISHLHPYDFEGHDELAMKLRLSLAKERLYGHIAGLDRYLKARENATDPGFIDGTAWARISQADKAMRETPPLTMHASAEMLQLLKVKGDTLDLKTVTRLLMNKTADKQPIAGKVYARARAGYEPTAFFELLYFPDKTVSVVYGLAGAEGRAAIRRVHEAAVDVAMQALTERSSWVRYGAGSVNRERGEGAWIRFGGQHMMSKAGDPHLHTHVALLNIVRSLESSRVGGFDLHNLHGHFASKTFERPYQEALARGLTALGYNVAYDHKRAETIVRGVPEPILRALSSRTEVAKAAVEKALAAQHPPISFASLTPVQRAQWISVKMAETKRLSNEAVHGPHDWEARAIAAVGTKEWEKMAEARGWVRQPRPNTPRRQKENWLEERGPITPMGAYYHRGGQDEIEWDLRR